MRLEGLYDIVQFGSTLGNEVYGTITIDPLHLYFAKGLAVCELNLCANTFSCLCFLPQLLSAMIHRMGEKEEDPLPQANNDGADSDEWSD